MPAGISVPGVTSEPAATIARVPMREPSSTVDPLPTSASSAMVAPCTTEVWPMVAPGPISTACIDVTWTTAQSWTLAPRRTTIGEKSARSTALYQTDAFSSTVTSPTSTAVGAMNALGWTRGVFPSKLNSGMGPVLAVFSKSQPILSNSRVVGGFMRTPKITAVATATPPHRYTQADIMDAAGYTDAPRRAFFEHSDIESRYLWIPRERLRPDESVDELAARARDGALALSETAARRALERAGWQAADVDFVVTTTCTARLTPSIDAHLVGRLGCRPEVQRAHIGDTGCASAMVALQQAWNHLRAFPSHRALLVSGDLLGGVLPRRPAGIRGGPRHLRRRRRGARAVHRRPGPARGRAPDAVPARAPGRHGLRVPGRPAPRDPLEGRPPQRRHDARRGAARAHGRAGPQT